MRRIFTQFIASFLVLTCCLSRAADDTEINAKVVAFCEKHLKEQVGDGECAVLAQQALRDSGARGVQGDNPGKMDYVWGKEILFFERGPGGLKVAGKFEDIRPGDIIQYRDAKFKGTRLGRTYTTTAAHHTSIVYKVEAKGWELKIFEQNTNGRKTVSEATLRIDDLKEGWIRIYQPVASERK